MPADEFVLHFGGRPNEVNAFTFSNSLIALGEALQEINSQINEAFSVEISIEGVGPGSFRAKLKTRLKALSSLFAGGLSKEILVGILSAAIYEKAIKPIIGSPEPTIIINDGSVVVQSGSDRIIVPRNVYEAKSKLKSLQAVDRHISKAFSALEADSSVSNFGLAHDIHDREPVGLIARERFAIMAEAAEAPSTDDRRYEDVPAKLVILKAVFERGARLWQFVWNGIRISAPIKDQTFFDRLARREVAFTQGDVLNVVLRVHQYRDEMSGVFINEPYEVIEVRGPEPMPRQQGLF